MTSTQVGTGAYEAAFRRSIEDPSGFWGEAAKGIDWVQAPTQVLDDANPPFYKWFPLSLIHI